jgi:hypothetical protein
MLLYLINCFYCDQYIFVLSSFAFVFNFSVIPSRQVVVNCGEICGELKKKVAKKIIIWRKPWRKEKNWPEEPLSVIPDFTSPDIFFTSPTMLTVNTVIVYNKHDTWPPLLVENIKRLLH